MRVLLDIIKKATQPVARVNNPYAMYFVPAFQKMYNQPKNAIRHGRG